MVYYATLNRNIGSKDDIPTISTALESVRSYQWEVEFHANPATGGAQPKPLTLAAKQVNGIGMQVEDIEVNRVNDKVYYAGKPSMEELRVTFDNISEAKISKVLFDYFSNDTYDPASGEMTDFNDNTGGGPGGWGKAAITLRQLKPDMTLLNEIQLVGAYPKKWTPAEYNYATNDFHTVEVSFRYDFLLHN
jgi:hypothetical protein